MTHNTKLLTGIMTKCFTALLTGCMTVLISGCTSTDVLDHPNNAETKGQTITLNISCPDAATSTRADNDHVLRYSAFLYKGAEISSSTEVMRKDVLEGNDDNKVTFEVEDQGTYSVRVIADYIPNNPEPIATNYHYPDKYYDTESKTTDVYMLSVKNFNTNEKIVQNCINNENYDLFASKKISIVKESKEVEEEITLQRVVSRISLVNTTTIESDVNNITINNFDFLYRFNLVDASSELNYHSTSYSSPLIITGIKPVSTKIGEELLFFYSLAKPNSRGELLKMTVTVNPDESTENTLEIPESKIKPIANYKISVTGPFIAKPEVESNNIILEMYSPDTTQWNEESVKNE